MQDIDFDEIDRAVNSITSNDVPTNMTVVPKPTAAATEQVAQIAAEPEAVSVIPSPAVRRSSGRFMDVVHPSSDMRPTTLTRPAAPSAPSLHREEVVARDEVAARPEPAAVSSAAFHWPDAMITPVAAAEAVVAEVIEPSVAEPTPEVVQEAPVIAEPADLIDDDDDASPLESPFLTDAKVEKRPLGAFSGADADLPLLEDPIPFSNNPAPTPMPTLDADFEPEVVELSHEEHEETPHELHEELLKLDGHAQDEPLLEATNPPDKVSTLGDVSTGPTSITQQYKETPSDTPLSGSIFDTEAYHQPLAHATKKRSGALIVVWIIALILVGGGIGAAIYFVVLPMLG